MSALISKLETLWSDKNSIRNRNEFILTLLHSIKYRADKITFLGGGKEQIYFNGDDAFSDTVLFALREWDKYADLQSYLAHIFGYLKYYKFKNKYWQQKYLACEYEFMERLTAKYSLQSIGEINFILSKLPETEREVLEMFVLDGWSKKEISIHLEVPEHSVDKIYKQALKLCRLQRCRL